MAVGMYATEPSFQIEKSAINFVFKIMSTADPKTKAKKKKTLEGQTHINT